MRTNKHKSVKILHGNLIKSKSGGYTAFFEEFPEIVAEGENVKEAKQNLITIFVEVMQYKRERANDAIAKPNLRDPEHTVKRFALSVV